MRRIKIVLAVAAAMAVMVTAGVAPAMAATNNNDTQLDRQDVRLDQQLLNQNNGFESCDDCGFNDGFAFNNFFNSFNDQQSCWEWSWVFSEWEWECA